MRKPGRPHGAKSQKLGRFVAELIATKKNFDPLETLIDIAKGDWKALGYDKGTYTSWTAAGIEYESDLISVQERNKAAKEVAKYLYSAKQSVELSNPDGQAFRVVIEDYGKKRE